MPEQIPEGWTKTTIGAVTQEINTRVGARKGVRVLSSTKHYGLVPSDEYFKNRTIYSSDTSNYKLVREGVFAYATNHLAEGSIGYQDRFDEACVSPIYTVFSCGESVHGPYFFRLLKSVGLLAQYKLHEQASVDRRGAIRYPDFSKIQIVLPSVGEQRRISEALDVLDGGMGLLRKSIEKRSLVREGELGRLLSSGDRLGWVGGEVQDFGDVRMGRQRSPKHESGECLTPYLRVANVFDGYIDYSDVLEMNFTPGEQKVYGLLPGDILLNEGQSLDLVGRSSVYQGLPGAYCYQNTLIRYRCFASLDSEFAQLVFQSWLNRGYFSRVALQTTSIAHLGSDRFARMRMNVPPLEEQRRIVSIVRAHDERIAAEKARLEKLRKLKAGLMDDLLAGRVRVDQIDEFPV